MTFGQDTIKLLRDYPFEIVQKRRKCEQTRQILYGVKDVRCGVFYPARRRITFKGKEKTFTNSDASYKYAEEIVAKAETED